MEKKEMRMENKKFMFVPITFEEACDVVRTGVSDMVYLEMNVGYNRLLPICEVSNTSLKNWLKGAYYKKVEVTKGYFHIHPEYLE